MLRKSLLLSAILISVLTTVPGARADICFQYGSGGGLSVAIGAKVPAANTCTPVTLVEQLVPFTRVGVATGSICRSEVGFSVLVLQYTYPACTGPGSYFESATCEIRLSDQSDLPTKPSDQISSCNGVYAGLQLNQAGPLRQFADK